MAPLKQTENSRLQTFARQAHLRRFSYSPPTVAGLRLLGNSLFFAGYFRCMVLRENDYIFFVSYFRCEGNRLWLLSPLVENTQARCHSFMPVIVVDRKYIWHKMARGCCRGSGKGHENSVFRTTETLDAKLITESRVVLWSRVSPVIRKNLKMMNFKYYSVYFTCETVFCLLANCNKCDDDCFWETATSWLTFLCLNVSPCGHSVFSWCSLLIFFPKCTNLQSNKERLRRISRT